MRRSIVLATGGRHRIFAYLFAKKDRANIREDHLADSKKPVQAYACMTDSELGAALSEGDLLKLCDEEQSQVQERRRRGDP
jgi:hypothetical protein